MQYFKIDPQLSERAHRAAVANGVELPEIAKRQIANQFHMMMIVRGFAHLAERFGPGIWQEASEAMYQLGREIGPELYAMLGVDTSDARGLSKAVDAVNICLDIVGEEVSSDRHEVVRREHECLMSENLRLLDGHHYCGLYQQIYRGVLHVATPGETGGCNNLECTRSRGDAHCELKTWVGRDDQRIPAGRP